MHKHQPTYFYCKSRGFTLIELLVVISIISLLIAILLPALASARATSQRIKCATGERQIGLAIFMYADSFRDYVPRVGRVGTVWEHTNIWSSNVSDPWSRVLMENDFIKEPAGRTAGTFPRTQHPFYCPSDNSDYGGGSNAGKRSYSLSEAYVWNGTVTTPKRRSDIVSPANVMLTAEDSGVYHFALGGSAVGYYHFKSLDGTSSVGMNYHHLGDTANILFGDGHVQAADREAAGNYIFKNADLP
ncbi:MAG: hypothetical protein CMJ19_19550 [Phycisphaeraceae bacterium]|nr:hypothetical protein [Phycisphaeraceae bacterium]